METERLRRILEENLQHDHMQVKGDGRHFEALIVSSAFEGLSRVKRHQMVYAVLGDLMREAVHALSLKTLTPQEWKSLSNTNHHQEKTA